jgi:hypothetical protein
VWSGNKCILQNSLNLGNPGDGVCGINLFVDFFSLLHRGKQNCLKLLKLQANFGVFV